MKNPFLIILDDNSHVEIGDPYILRFNGKYYLYCSTCDDLEGIRCFISDDLVNFERKDDPIDLPANANNPSVVVLPTGKILLYFRDGELKVTVAKADSLESGFRLLAYDIFDGKRAEDMFVFVHNSKFYMVAEDNVAEFTGHERFGFMATSNDGMNWEPAKEVIAYDHTIKFEDGSELKAQRRERPQFVFENGKPVCLFTAVYDGENTFNVAQAIELKEKTDA